MRYFSTFTGIGGLDFGLADWCECVGFSDIKESSIKIYKNHYPDHKNFGDIIKMDYKNLPDFDLMIGGFPCQAFSIAGAREGFKNRKGQLIFYVYDLLMVKQPKFVVLENVKGLLIHEYGRTFEKVIRLLSMAGYFVRVLLLNAVNYGSAQNRERLLFLCSKEDFSIKIPEIIDNTKRFRDIRDSEESRFVWVKETERNVKKINQQDLYPFDLVGGYDIVGTLTTGISGGGGRNPSSQQKIVQERNGKFRFLTVVEGERLQGFNDNWTDGISLSGRWFAIGNAVNCKMSDYLFKNYLKGLWW